MLFPAADGENAHDKRRKYDDNHHEYNNQVYDHHPESGGHDDDFGYSDHDDRSLKRKSLPPTFGLRRYKNYCKVLLEIYIAQILMGGIKKKTSQECETALTSQF